MWLTRRGRLAGNKLHKRGCVVFIICQAGGGDRVRVRVGSRFKGGNGYLKRAQPFWRHAVEDGPFGSCLSLAANVSHSTHSKHKQNDKTENTQH